uniref:Uncharacterized protein n=1 Tax=Prevotella sp. GTC17260 TaxID=3236796 RepID=A0AB33JEU8_9BACT
MKKKIINNKQIIQSIEEDLVSYYEGGCSKEDDVLMDYLITQRKYLLNDLFEPNAENYRLLGEFNEALKDIVLKSYKQSRELYFNTKKTLEDSASNLNFEGVECKIFLGKDRQYPTNHPIQGERAESMWDVLSEEAYNNIYSHSGCCLGFNGYSGEQDEMTELEVLGLENGLDCWNEGLDREWSHNLHLHQHFHNLYDHMSFSIYDFIYVRDFYVEFHLEFNNNASNMKLG